MLTKLEQDIAQLERAIYEHEKTGTQLDRVVSKIFPAGKVISFEKRYKIGAVGEKNVWLVQRKGKAGIRTNEVGFNSLLECLRAELAAIKPGE